VLEGRFRPDLFHRLSVFRLVVPPLCERKEDVEDLLPPFIEEFNAKADNRVSGVSEAVWRRLASYDWPGNVRELRNVVERCVLLSGGPVFPERWPRDDVQHARLESPVRHLGIEVDDALEVAEQMEV